MVRIGTGIDKIWLPTETGMIELENVSTDMSTVAKACIADIDDDSAYLLQDERRRRPSVQQSDLDELLITETIVSKARQEQRAENRATGAAPSKQDRKANRRENARKERHALGAHDPGSTEDSLQREAGGNQSQTPIASRPDASDTAMHEFLRGLS